MKIAFSRFSSPSAHRLAEALDAELVFDSTTPVEINWGRSPANSELNRDTSTVTNKRVMREKFRDAGVPMPTLYDLDGITLPAIGRPDRHTKGRGLWKCETEADVAQALRGRVFRNGRRKVAATHFMEFVEAPREFRVHVFKDRVIRLSEKDFSNPDPEPGGRHYTTISSTTYNIGHVREAARKAVSAVGLDFGAVDVLASDEQAWVLEVNSAPGLGGTMPELYARVFREWKEGRR